MATGLSGTIVGRSCRLRRRVRFTNSARCAVLPSSRCEHAVSENEIPHDLFTQSKYRIVRVLGRGGMGTVYEAEHVRMKRPVAIKVINPELVNIHRHFAQFEEEIKAVASLDHVNIARAFDAENIGSLQVFVMEFVRGQTLYEFLNHAAGCRSWTRAAACGKHSLACSTLTSKDWCIAI